MNDNRDWKFNLGPFQRLYEAWLILRGSHSLHRSWQRGHDHGTSCEYHRLIINKAYLAETQHRESLATV